MSNWLDNTIGFFSPKAALERAKYRAALNEVRKYDGAAKGRRTSGWGDTGTSANTETQKALKSLRDRSRELTRNNPYSKKAVATIARNTVGTGIRPRPLNGGDQATELMKLWNAWADVKTCDYDGLKTFYGLQRLAMRTIVESGEVLVRKRIVNDKENPLRLQVLEPDFIDSAKDGNLVDGGYAIQGVEFDKDGKRVAYWLFDRHPGDYIGTDLTSKRVPAEQILHIYNVERPGQVRGIPFGASSMLRLKDFDDYEDAQLVRQKIAACFSVFIQDSAADSISTGSTSTDLASERVEPGMIEKLGPGKTVAFASPPAAEGYNDYTRKVLQGIAAGYDVTYEALTGDLSNVNFSSGRMGWLEFQRAIQDWQLDMLIPMFCDPVWKWFIEANKIAKGGTKETIAVEWTPPRREMIDPVKETEAIITAIRGGLTSWQEAVRELGFDPDTLLAHIKEDNAKFDRDKIAMDSDARRPKNGGAPASPAEPPKPTE